MIDDFLAFLTRSKQCFKCTLPELTPYEEMLAKLAQGHQDTVFAFNWSKQQSKKSDDEIKAEWRRYAEDERMRLRSSIPVKHTLEPAPIDSSLSSLKISLRGASDTLYSLYQRHNGAQLFTDADDLDSGLVFLSITEMSGELEDIKDWFDIEDDEAIGSEHDKHGMIALYSLPEWFNSSICFGAIACAAERFILAVEGPHRGSVFRFDHDPLALVQVTSSFDEFLDLLMSKTVPFVSNECGYHNASAYIADT